VASDTGQPQAAGGEPQVLDEAALVRLAKSGNVAAFEQLVVAYDLRIYHLAYRMLGNPEDARDMAQETFLRAYRSLGELRDEAAFPTWLFRIARNLCMDELRQRRRRPTVSLDEPVTSGEADLPRQMPANTPDPQRALEEQEMADAVERALASIPPEYRVAVVLRDLQGFSYEEMAAILEIPRGTVKSRLHRGRAALKALLVQAELLARSGVPKSERRPGP